MPLGSFLRGLGIYHPLRHPDRLDGALPHPLDDLGSKEPSFRPGTTFGKRHVGDRSLGHPSFNRALAHLEQVRKLGFVRMSLLFTRAPSPAFRAFVPAPGATDSPSE